jgi:hypothetical protein
MNVYSLCVSEEGEEGGRGEERRGERSGAEQRAVR